MKVSVVEYQSYKHSIQKALNDIEAGPVLAKQKAILIKPNLVNASPHPVTTPPEICEAVIDIVRSYTSAEIVIAEGCGDPSYETNEIYDLLGYTTVSRRSGVKLIDLNHSKFKKYKHSQCTIFPEMILPEIVFSHFLISVPVLKVHSFSDISGSMKNMIGIAPPQYYSGQHGYWKKSAFHLNIHEAIIELNTYRHPDLTVMDATIGLPDSHLGGRQCQPPANKIIAGYDAKLVDREAATLLGLNWQKIKHLQ